MTTIRMAAATTPAATPHVDDDEFRGIPLYGIKVSLTPTPATIVGVALYFGNKAPV